MWDKLKNWWYNLDKKEKEKELNLSHTLMSSKGFCESCGTKLIKTLWENKIYYDFKRGKPYKRYVYACPNRYDK